MKMCCSVYVVSLICNAFILVVVVLSSVSSESILLPLVEGDDMVLYGSDEMHQPVRKTVQKLAGVETSNTASNTVWFGPRLGRRKRSASPLSDDGSETSNEIDLNYIPSVLKTHPTSSEAILVYDGKNQIIELLYGRGNNNNNYRSDEEERVIRVKAPPFSPRLGRRSTIPLKPRLGRSGNNPEAALFKPRLGRDPGFSSNGLIEYSTK